MDVAVEHLSCKECGQSYPLDARFACDKCFGPLDVVYNYEGLDSEEAKRKIQAGPASIWRYSEFLPFERRPQTALDAGLTPLIKADRLAQSLGLGEVYVKNDAANPTHSFKDRVVCVALAKIKELGFDVAACASTGNLANAVAAHAAAAGLESYVFIPADLEQEKVLATGIYGTNLIRVRGTYDDVNRLCTELAFENPKWAFVNVNIRPYYSEGSKTLAFEVAEQLGFTLPDRVICPVASGSLITKLAKGFDEWISLSLVEGELPSFNGAQADGCSPVAQAWSSGADFCKPTKPDTIAKSLAIGDPADGPYVLDLAKRSGGSVESVSDEEIIEGIKLLARTTGIFTETAGGVTTAVLAKLAREGKIGAGERVVLYITGEGLKTLGSIKDVVSTYEVDPDVASFKSNVVEAVPA